MKYSEHASGASGSSAGSMELAAWQGGCARPWCAAVQQQRKAGQSGIMHHPKCPWAGGGGGATARM